MMINYDPLAAEYAQHRKGNSEVIRRLINRGRVTSATRVLEVGCGTGNYISALQKPTGCMAYGCDPSPAMLAQAKQSYPAVNFREGRGELIPFADETFDLVFSIDVIHHIEDHLRYFNESKRVLASDGRICTVTETSYQIRRRRPFAIYFPETVSVDLNRYPRISQLKRWMQAAGFT